MIFFYNFQWNQLLSSFKEGMQLKRKRWRLKSYEHCFSGAEALEWLHTYLQNHPSFGDHVTREQAFLLLQKFLDNKVFLNAVAGKVNKRFQDTNILYKFTEEDQCEDSKETKNDKENIPSQKSFTNLLKPFSRRNSRTISLEEYQQTPVGKIPSIKGPPPLKNDITSRSRIVTSSMTPLAFDLNNISMATTNDSEQDYYNMSTFLFDPADEDDIYNTSISQSRFMRSNSLRLNNRGIDNKSIKPLSALWEKSAVPQSNTSKPVINKKRSVMQTFQKTSSKTHPITRRHTVIVGQTETGESPSKKLKMSSSYGSVNSNNKLPSKNVFQSKANGKILDKTFINATHKQINKAKVAKPKPQASRSNLLPRKAVMVLGEKPSFINEITNYDTYEVMHLPGYKPSGISHSHSMQTMSSHPKTLLDVAQEHCKKADHKRSYVNPLLQEQCPDRENIKPVKQTKQKTPSFVPVGTTINVLSPRTSKKRVSPHPMRRRSFSQNNVLRNKCQSVNDLHHSTQSNNRKLKSLKKAPSMWSINTVGLVDEQMDKTCQEITTEDIEDAWKSVVLLRYVDCFLFLFLFTVQWCNIKFLTIFSTCLSKISLVWHHCEKFTNIYYLRCLLYIMLKLITFNIIIYRKNPNISRIRV